MTQPSEDQPTAIRTIHVFVHVPDRKHVWVNRARYFAQVPAVGEYFTLGPTGGWYEVVTVVHCAFEATFQAEVWAKRVNHLKVTPRHEDLLAQEPAPTPLDGDPAETG